MLMILHISSNRTRGRRIWTLSLPQKPCGSDIARIAGIFSSQVLSNPWQTAPLCLGVLESVGVVMLRPQSMVPWMKRTPHWWFAKMHGQCLIGCWFFSSRTNRGAPWAAAYSTSSVPRDFHSMRTLNRFQLINLTSTNLFDLPLFMNLLIPRLPSGVSEIRELLSGMSSTPTLCKFKVALCQRYLSRASVGAHPSSFRGRPRAQPRPITRRKHANRQDPTPLMTSDSKPEIAPLSSQNQHALPPASELLHLLAMQTNADALSNTIK